MKLSECKIGAIIITDDLEVGHIIGVQYNVHISQTGGMTNKEKFKHTIPTVRFPDGERGIHHSNIKLFKG